MRVNIKSCLIILSFIFLLSFLFLFSNTAFATGSEDDSSLNEPPETYAGQVIIKYTQNYKEVSEDGETPDESVLTAIVLGTVYPLYTEDYFTGVYLFKEGQMSWSYNLKRYNADGVCEFLSNSIGSGNIDIGHTEQIYYDSKIWLESDGEYTMDINNAGRFYLTADGFPTEDYNLAMKPLQTTTTLTSGGSGCGSVSGPTYDVPPGINIKLENLKATNRIISGEQVLYPDNGVKEMISYTIELPPVKKEKIVEEPDISADDASDKQSFLEVFWNWVKSLFGR